MIIVLAKCGNGYCGCDSEEAFFYEDDTSTQEINEEVYVWAVENAASFSHIHFGWDEEYTDEEYDDYLENYLEYDWYVATYQEYLDYCQNWNLKPQYTREEYVND